MTQSIPRGYWVRVFVRDGDPDGIRVVDKSDWAGCGLVVPRPLFAELRARYDLDRSGVYVLVGQTEVSLLPRVYVGEGDPVRERLQTHAKDKDFWTHAVVFTSRDDHLNKAHVQHLEARLVALATASKRCVLDNANRPQAPSLSEADVVQAEAFLGDVLLCMPILGYSFFESTPSAAPTSTELVLNGKGIAGRGFESSQGFVVRAGSQAVKEEKEVRSIHPNLKSHRAELVRQGVLVDRGPFYELSQDYTFSSPSMASDILLGRSSNGRTEWKTTDGRTLKSIQDAEAGG